MEKESLLEILNYLYEKNYETIIKQNLYEIQIPINRKKEAEDLGGKFKGVKFTYFDMVKDEVYFLCKRK
jgi:hypothetical protein